LDNRYRLYLISLFIVLPVTGFSQSGYDFSIKPDLWYNDVDGIRIGSFFEGRAAGTGHEGPHRLDGGFWIGTWIPSLPVSYRLTYTEPLTNYLENPNELNIQIHSSVREGYQSHGISFNKRWQNLQDFRNFWETGIIYSLEKRFDDEYVIHPSLWSDQWNGFIKPYLEHQYLTGIGIFNLRLNSRINTFDPFFYTTSLDVSQQIRLGRSWELRIRGYGEIIDKNSAEEYRMTLSSGGQINSLDSRMSRSKGTVPVSWVNRGIIHFSGGPNLRGYQKIDTDFILNGEPRVYNSIGAINLEFDFPNPVQTSIRNIDQLSEFLSFRSYIFSDVAIASGHDQSDFDGSFANLGAGIALSLNIPDFFGRPRGFVIRYESPFYLSEPSGEDRFKWRHLLGFGATITF
jgi:hypothetical protein